MIVAVLNEKGGVGKTTTTVTLGSALVELGKRVQLIGVDPQRDLTLLFSEEMSSENLVFADATTGTLKRTIDRKADFVLIDCPPALGPDVAKALSLADVALVPTMPAAPSLIGLERLMKTLDFARDPERKGGNPNLSWHLLLTLFDTGNPDAFTIEQRLRESLGDRVLSVTIKRHSGIESAAAEGRTILQTAPRIHPARAYRTLARELVNGWSDA
jgi:chromosome partitioning protein